MLYVVVFYAIIEIMKLYYDKKSKNPTYFIQQGFRNGKKTSTRNVAVIGKHCDLLKITDDPLAYAKQKVAEYNEQMKNSRVSMEVTIDFDEKIKASEDLVSSSTSRNIGYFFLQAIYHELAIGSFFKTVTAGSKITFDPNLVSRFLTCARILEPESKLATLRHLNHYYEQPEIEYQHIHRTLDILEENGLLLQIIALLARSAEAQPQHSKSDILFAASYMREHFHEPLDIKTILPFHL